MFRALTSQDLRLGGSGGLEKQSNLGPEQDLLLRSSDPDEEAPFRVGVSWAPHAAEASMPARRSRRHEAQKPVMGVLG